MAINNIHEMLHIFGMVHSYQSSNLWPDTAPYAIANYAGWLIENFFEKPEGSTTEIDTPINEQVNRIKKPTIWGRVKMFFRRIF